MNDAAERVAKQIWPDDQRSMTLGSEDAIDKKQQYFAGLIRAEYQELVDAAKEAIEASRTDGDSCTVCLGDLSADKHASGCAMESLAAALKKVSP